MQYSSGRGIADYMGLKMYLLVVEFDFDSNISCLKVLIDSGVTGQRNMVSVYMCTNTYIDSGTQKSPLKMDICQACCCS